MKKMRGKIRSLVLIVSILFITISMHEIKMGFSSQNNVIDYEYTLWIGGYPYGYTVPTPGGGQMSVYPLHVYSKSGSFLQTFKVTRDSTKYAWPHSGTQYNWPDWGTFDDPYGEDATCPPGVYWATYDNVTNKARPRIILSDVGPTAWKVGFRMARSDLGTVRGAIQIHKLYDEMLGCMGLPTQNDMTDLMNLLYGSGNVDPLTGIPYDEAWAATITLRVIINPARFSLSCLTILSSEGGTTNPSAGEYMYPYGTKGGTQGDLVFPTLIYEKFAEVSASPSNGYKFDHWELDGGNYGEPYGGSNPTYVDMITDHTLHAVFVLSGPSPGVGGIVVPVDKFGLLAPYIGLASTIMVASVAAAICVKRVKRRKEKQ